MSQIHITLWIFTHYSTLLLWNHLKKKKKIFHFIADSGNEWNPGILLRSFQCWQLISSRRNTRWQWQSTSNNWVQQAYRIKPEISSSPFKYDPLFQSWGKFLSLRILINPKQCRWKTPRPYVKLKAVYLAPRKRSHQGQTLESLGPFPLSASEPSWRRPWGLCRVPLKQTNRIQVFWSAYFATSSSIGSQNLDFRDTQLFLFLHWTIKPDRS